MTKLLRRFGALGWSGELSPSRCRGSPFLHTRRYIETATHPTEPSGSPPPAHPRWALLNRHCCGADSSSVPRDDNKTTVRSRSSMGRPFRVSLGLAVPPASSIIYLDSGDDRGEEDDHPDMGAHVVTAHGDSVLLELSDHVKLVGLPSPSNDYFLYTAGGTASRPPLLSLLPFCYIPTLRERSWSEDDVDARMMSTHDTGLLMRRGENGLNFLVAQLEVTYDAPYEKAELCVLRHGCEWELKRDVPVVAVTTTEQRWCPETRTYVPVVAGQKPPLRCRETTEAVAVGDRFLCWVNCDAGTFLVCDMTEENPKLHYVPLPVDPVQRRKIGYYSDSSEDDEGDFHPIRNCRSIGAAGDGAVRLISIDPRCCCGGHGRSTCARSRFAFRVSAWVLRLSTKGVMAWVKDGLLDSDELWSLPGYQGLPRVYLECPVVSTHNPDVVCFIVREEDSSVSYAERKVWMLEVDTRRKALLSVCRYTSQPYTVEDHLPVNLHC